VRRSQKLHFSPSFLVFIRKMRDNLLIFIVSILALSLANFRMPDTLFRLKNFAQ
jgi:predicted membrane-bound mannosyltransferase